MKTTTSILKNKLRAKESLLRDLMKILKIKNYLLIKIPNISSPPGELLKYTIRSKGYTQVDFERITGIPQSYTSNIINGRKSIGMKIDVKLNEALDTPPEFWLKLSESYVEKIKKRNEN